MKRPRPLARSTPEGSLEDAPLQPLMQAQGLTFAFETTPVLDSLTFSLAPGEVLGIIGPNGSGKSTLLRLAGGLLPSPKGSLQFKGRDLHSYKTRLLAQSIAWVPQESHLPFSFTAGEVVMMGRHPYLSALGFESGEDFHSTAQAMEITDTAPFAHRRFNELSGGEKQRVMIASAIAQEPELMLLDEPTASLDLKYQVQVLKILEKLNVQEGMTLMLALHDLHLASQFCTQLVLLQNGRAVHQGAPPDVLKKDVLEEVYGVRLKIFTDPQDGSLLVYPEKS